MDEDEAFCRICGEYRRDLNHDGTVDHRFQSLKFGYNNCRKQLVKDRHGVTVNIEVKKINNFYCDFRDIKGKYITKVTPEQLRLHNYTITFNCKIKNIKNDEALYVTSTNLLHLSKYFSITYSHTYEKSEQSFLRIPPGKYFPFQVTFNTDVSQCASYKIPLSCDIQTIDNKYCFTIIRTFLVIVDTQAKSIEEKLKSPFTCQSWKDVQKTIPSTKETHYKDNNPIPRHHMRIFARGLEPCKNMTDDEERILRSIREQGLILTKEKYAWFWHMVLWMEETALSLMLMKYNMERVTLKIINYDTLILEVPGLAEKRPSVIAGDFIRIRISDDHTAYKGFVDKVNEKTIEISHVDDELIEYLTENPDSEMDVAFSLGRLALERMHKAVDRIVDSGMVEKLFPSQVVLTQNSLSRKLKFYNESIYENSEQRNAVYQIVNSCQDLPYIVFGPPGTGKTVTIVEAMLQIKKLTTKRILVCAPANSACDMLATKLKQHCTRQELIRIHSSTREMITIPQELEEYSNIEDDEFVKIDLDKLASYRIVVTTLTLIGRFCGQYHPDCVFIDEAAQASEPEADIAIALLDVGKQVVLAGDPKQLGPMATDCAAKYGLGTSLMERLMKYPVYQLDPKTRTYNTDLITMLKLNFRSHPHILQIPNERFYNNLLEPKSQTAEQDPIVNIAIFPTIARPSGTKRGTAIEFCSVSAKERREGSSPSFFNPFEVKKVVEYVDAILRLNVHDVFRVRENQIGVVTPYKRQVHKIQEALKHKGFENVEVGTTESFQGREKRVIIISTVRAQHSLLLHDRKYKLGFVKNDQRFNVAVTRAISKLIVIGSPLVLRTDVKWASYMELCVKFGTYFGNYFAPDDSVFRNDVISRMENFREKDDQYQASSTN